MMSISRQRGAIALTFTFMLPAIMSLLAMTVFFSMYSQVVIRTGQAAEAAGLACTYQQRNVPTVIDGILNYYRPNFVLPALGNSVSLDGDKACNISVQYHFKPAMNKLLPVEVNSSSLVTSNSGSSSKLVANVIQNQTDFSLVLDISGSMVSDLPELKRIITDVISDIDPGNNQVRFSIVPFQTGVGVTAAPWLPSSKASPKCVDGLAYRNGSFDADKTVELLNSSSKNLDFKEVTPGRWLDRCSQTAFILPLTNDLNNVIDYVNSLSTSGTTASYQGLIWGVRTLTEKWQLEWKITPVTSSSLTQRLILFTDGSDNGGGHFDDLMNAGLCDEIQQNLNIEVSFIGFGVSANRIKQFQQCAGRTGAVFDAKNSADLAVYFENALKVESKPRLVLGQ
ncbi:VWA domain-containing protein [Moritella sp. Urea-trap-13]|uniref:vWA domain-containing protein n=1 Tax=Moritella sp. Urea-trap-13 TaxID=2058327 RepID=UPI000C322870|nr:VWA domain-containing protein [Moritella sp. Urea-trap-13]PKH05944.1 hypothetical protein CXF93_08360 [Moritella sp. Urea-trap-13]